MPSAVIATSKDTSKVKIAVEMVGQVPQLIEFDQKQPLAAIIHELAAGWRLSEAENYALQFSETTNNNYVTEKNRNEIRNGSVLRLTQSPSSTAQEILRKLQNTSDDMTERSQAMLQLSKLSVDLTFALEFINTQVKLNINQVGSVSQ